MDQVGLALHQLKILAVQEQKVLLQEQKVLLQEQLVWLQLQEVSVWVKLKRGERGERKGSILAW